jgi:hypothetical protein
MQPQIRARAIYKSKSSASQWYARLKNMLKSLSEQMETTLNLLITVLTKLKKWLNFHNSSYRMPKACHNIWNNWELISPFTASASQETHFTVKGYLKLPDYTAYHTNHPARTAWGGTAIIFKNCNKHDQLNSYSQDFLQATSVCLDRR